jgi:hypothetical protein
MAEVVAAMGVDLLEAVDVFLAYSLLARRSLMTDRNVSG